MGKNKRKRKIVVSVASTVLILIIIAVVGAVYVRDYYRTDREAVEAFAPIKEVSVDLLDDNTLVFGPEKATKGFIFYPGGKVEYTAYQPLMAACAQQGILCILVEMPFNLAVLDIHAAEGIQRRYPEVEEWYIGGHSLGGAMAASYVSGHVDEYEVLLLLAAYSAADLSDSGLNVISIYGSEDQVLKMESYEENKENLPEDFVEVVIDGGCHSGFAYYGEQDGDGVPTITQEEQIEETVKMFLANIE